MIITLKSPSCWITLPTQENHNNLRICPTPMFQWYSMWRITNNNNYIMIMRMKKTKTKQQPTSKSNNTFNNKNNTNNKMKRTK